MSLASHQHVAGAEIRVDGSPLGPEVRNNLLEVLVKDNLALPGTATIRLSDPRLATIDSHPLQLGKKVEIKLGAMTDRTPSVVFKGDVVAIEPDFAETGVAIVVRLLERTHKLFRKQQSRTFQNMKASDMFTKVMQEAGLAAGTVDQTAVIHKYFHQAAESDWEFLNRLAIDNDREVVADGDRVHFRTAGVGSGTPIPLAYGATLLAFRPRLSGVQQVTAVNVRGWDPVGKQAIVGNASAKQPHSTVGKRHSQVASALGNGEVLIADRTVDTQSAATAIANSERQRLTDAYVEAEGTCFGNPRIRAGTKVKIEQVGSTFGGTYVVTSATHQFRGGTGYKTHFTISGRSPRTLLDLMRQPEKRNWGASFVVGIVTNTNDPDQMGRVKVKLPALAADHESWWARVLTPSAGAGGRGMYMLPQVNEEVVVGFENGDAQRPYVLGSVFNGKDKPGPDLLQSKDGSFAMKSDKKIWMKSMDDIVITSDKNMTLDIKTDMKAKMGGGYTNEATGNTKLKAQQINIEAGGSLTIKGVSVTVEASASLSLKGATISMQGNGPVQIKGTPISIG